MHFPALNPWLRDNLLPTVVLLLGAALLGGLVRWVAARYRAALDENVREHIEGGGVVPEGAKRARAVGQAVEWAVISLIYFIAGIGSWHQRGVPLTSLLSRETVSGVSI